MNDKVKYGHDYTYNSRVPLHADLQSLPEKHQDLLTKDPHFCMIPWIHMHAFPDGRAYPCCMSEYDMHVGDLKTQTMKEVWNSEGMRQMRVNMLNGKPSKECGRCYEQEKAGFVSMRHRTSQNFGQHIALTDQTKPDGTVDEFKLRYKYASKMYTASILLKQGIYNYLYIFGPDKNGKTDAKLCEGSHFNTENDYTVLFYHRAYTNEFDELIGYTRLNSVQR
jgi:radical SAM protein with 4Fe4S-binding SPASM domain